MFAFSPNAIQLDGSVISRQSTVHTLVSSGLPVVSIVSSLQDYIKECSGYELVQNVIRSVVNELEGASASKKSLALIFARELVRILSIYLNTRQSQQPTSSLKDFRQQLVGASGLSLSSYLAQYIIASSDSDEELSSSTVAALITLIEVAVLLERRGSWPSKSASFIVSGATRPQILTASRMSDCSFSVPVILDTNTVIVKGSAANLPKLTSYIQQHYNKVITTKALKIADDLPTASILDFPHPTTPDFATLMMEELPPVLMRLQGFISRNSNFPSERLLKIPLVSPFDGCVTGKSLVCQVRMVPSMGTPMFDAMIDFLIGRPVDLPLLRSTINFVLNKQQERSLFVLSSTSESHEIQADTTKSPSFEFGEKEVPLNVNQKMIALHQQRYPSSSIYNITDIVRVTGVVNKDKLIDAVQMLYVSHPSCTMVLKDNDTAVMPNQGVVRSMAEKTVFMHEPIREEDLMTAVTANTKVPFVLSEPTGLLRFHIFPIVNTKTTVIQGMVHHLASDGFSGFSMPPRMIQFYQREDDFFWYLAHALRPSAVDVMIHFNACQTQLAQTDNTMKQFWTSKITSGEFDNRLDMLTSNPRGGTPTFNGAERIVKLESSLWEGLKNKSSELGSTRFHLLVAAWSIVISRYSQQNKFNLGTAFHCRKEDWLDATIFTSNAMPVRVEVDHDQTLGELVASLKKSVDSCKKNEEYPASALIKDILDTKRIATAQGQNPLFQIEVNYYHIPSLPKISSKDLVMKERIYPQYMQAGMTDLTAWFVTLNNGVILNIKYNTDLYKQDLIEQIESDLLNLLSLLVKSSAETKVQSIVRTSGKSLESRGHGPSRKGPFIPMFARVMNFGSSSKLSDRLAVADNNTTLTFNQLSMAACGIAKMLQSHVTGKHQVVAVLMDRSVLYTTSMIGIMSAGCVYLPLNSADPIERIRGILVDAQASVVITQQNKVELLRDIKSVTPLVITLDSVMKPVEVSLPVIGARDPCYMIFTSGTTGKPKGVVVPHMALSNLANEMSSSFSDVQGACLALFEFSFDAHMYDVVMSISRGCPLVISKQFGNKDPQYIVDTIATFRVTTIMMVPSMLSMVLDYININETEKSKFSSVQFVGCGGEALYVKLVSRITKLLPAVQVINNYGPTEACVLCSYYDCNNLPSTKSPNDIVPIGAPIRNSELLILGEDRNIVPIGVTGQLYIGGDCLALGYANNPQQTQSKFVDHPYAEGKRLYASGDLAKYLPSGEIHFLGRSDNQIKLRGYRIECGEIESAIVGCSEVKMSSVVVHKSEQRDQCLVGFVEFDSSSVKSGDDKVSHLTNVLGELKTKLPQYMVPTRLVAIDNFPLTSHGKVDTKQLPNPFKSAHFVDQHASRATGDIKPLSSQVEKTIAKCFADVLGTDVSTIGSNSNFFDLGGSSLHAFTLVNKISEALSVKLELKQFFDNASPGELAKLFDVQVAKQKSETSLERFKKKPLTHYECVKLKEATEAPATNIFLVHGAFRNGVVFKDVASKFPAYVTVYSFQDSTPLDVQETDDDQPTTMEEFANIYVKLLMKTQRSGIYHLAGYCFGGVLVCEMAHQMLQKGCNVCTVAMIDSTAPSIVNARGLSDISAPTIFRMISFEIAMALIGKTSDLTEEYFKHLKTPQQQKQALIDAFSDKLDKKILVPFVDRALAHFASSSGLLTNYRFKPLRGRITLLSAQQKWALYNFYNPMGMNDLGWKTLHENMDVTMTPGDHLTIIRDTKAIDVVVDNLVKLLEQEGMRYMKLPTVRETLNLQSVPMLSVLEKRVPNDLLRIDIPESGPINPLVAIHRAVYFSLMAPSGHNVQPWKIFIDETNLKIVLCLNKKRVPSFFLAVDSMSFYDRVGMGAAIFVMKQLLLGYGFQVTQQVLSSNPNLEMEPFAILSVTPAGAGTAKPAVMKRQQSLGAMNKPKMINSPTSVPKQPNSPVMPRDGQLLQGPSQMNQVVQAPKKMMGLPKRPLPGVQHGEIRRSPSASVLSQNQSGPQVAAAGQEIPKQPSSPMLTRPIPSSQSSPNISRQERQESVKQFESLVSQRVTNRHYYSKRRVVPMRTLQHLSNPALSQEPVRVVVVNDPSQIEMISRYVEDVETNSYISDCVRKGLIGNIGVHEEQRNRTIPLDALELGQMQLVTATKVVTMDQNTIMTMRAHKALGIATGQKIFHSAGLLIFVGPRDHSLNELTNALGATLISAMLKCTEYNIATQPWTTAFLLQRMQWPLNGRLSPFGEQIRSEVTQETPDYFEQLDLLRHIVPQIKDNEMPLIVVRFGYPDEEISGHSTRLPASDSVTLIKRGDSVPNEIKTVLN